MATAPPRTVLLVEDHALTRGLLQRALEGEGFRVVAMESSRRAIREFEGIDPDVLLLDIDLGERPNGIDLAEILCTQAPHLGVVFLSNFPAVEAVEGRFRPPAGACFVHKGSIDGPGAVVSAIESALDDQARHGALSTLPADHPLRSLSASQMAVLRLIAEGCSNARIAERRGITVRSAERMVSRTFTALGIDDDPKLNPRVVATRIYVRDFGVPEPSPTMP